MCGGGTPYCIGGSCQCGSSADCGAGQYCEGGACLPCDDGTHCGPDCVACPAATPVCENAQCVACIDGTDCGGGTWCQAGLCVPCGADDPQHCGPACAACAGKTPTCAAGACACTGTSCGVGAECLAGSCAPCDTDSACGPTCEPCAGAKPYCANESTGCVACLVDPHCPPDQHCAAGACVPNCSPSGCEDNLAPNGYTCATAKVVGRTHASQPYVAVVSITDDFKNKDDLPSSLFNPPPLPDDDVKCWDALNDAFWRVWLFAGETLTVSLSAVQSNYDPMMKLYKGTLCAANWEPDLIHCYQQNSDGKGETLNHVATADGWYTVVVDGRHASDEGEGKFTFTLSVACKDAGCCCQ